MCRNIRPLNNFEPPATRDEVTAAALQYVRKVAGTTKPSQANEEVFYAAVKEIAHITEHLLDDLVTAAPPKNREVESAKARARAQARYALQPARERARPKDLHGRAPVDPSPQSPGDLTARANCPFAANGRHGLPAGMPRGIKATSPAEDGRYGFRQIELGSSQGQGHSAAGRYGACIGGRW